MHNSLRNPIISGPKIKRYEDYFKLFDRMLHTKIYHRIHGAPHQDFGNIIQLLPE